MDFIAIVTDLVAVVLLVFAFYLPRHKRKDLAVALIVVNIGVLAVAIALASVSVGAGLGLGIFGVLSIIRLRSTELSQVEIGYYFAALAMGLIGGLGVSATATGLEIALIAGVLLAVAVADSRLLGSYQTMSLVVDRALSDETELSHYISQRSGIHCEALTITRLDYVNDLTWVDLRYKPRQAQHSGIEQAGFQGVVNEQSTPNMVGVSR